nr:uncharacterized protein LOC117684259 [Crassostrea gigas]
MASNDVFGDPCVNTSKYLQVYYTCEPIVYTLPPLTTTKIPTTATEVTVTINNPPQIQVCDAIYFEDRNWPYTNVGEVASMSCIPPKVGRITWRCTGNGWEGERPDDSNCQTPVTAEESTKEVTVPREEKCRLPSNVDVEAISPGDVEGFKFGDTLTSRHEYVGWKSLRVNATIEIEFKTTSSGGIMLYATDRRKTDFISLIMKDGHLVFSFNSGSGALNLKTDQKYNDGKWHTVEFGRNKKTGKISVDGGAAKEGTSPGPTQSLNLRKPFFVGGINPDLSSNDKVKKHLQGVLGSFEGCMRNMKQNYESFGQSNAIQVSSCVANLERGTFFNDQGCYITLLYTLPPLTTTKIPTTTTEVTITTNNPPQIQVCDAIYFEDRNWPYTNVGEVASMSCIPPKVGRITWRCTGNGWEGERPDDSNCQTPVTVYTLPPLTTTKIPTTTTEVTITTNNPPQIQVCDAIYFEDRNWPYTNVGEVASMSCIPPKVGRITWRCTGNGWEGERPDDSNCQTPVTGRLISTRVGKKGGKYSYSYFPGRWEILVFPGKN